MRIALGFRTHSGWAALVAAGGTLESPRVYERRRIEIADAELAGSRQPYHAAAELPLEQAEQLVRTAIDSTHGLAKEAIRAAIQRLRSQEHEVVACGVLLGSGKSLPELGKILASHAMIHTAEGEMFREAIAWAANECGLPVTGTREKEIDAESVQSVATLGKLIGPPWTQDQKLATLAALRALLVA